VIDRPGDVAVSSDGASAWVSGFTVDGTAAIFSVSLANGAATPMVSGAPLMDPAQLDESADGTMLYVSDSLAGGGGRADGVRLVHLGLVADRAVFPASTPTSRAGCRSTTTGRRST